MPVTKNDYREKLSELFLDLLEKKGESWKKEWGSLPCLPHNAVSGRKYRGSNSLMLSLVSLEKGYSDPRWATMNQINDVRGIYHTGKWKVRKGSHPVYVECFLPFDRNEKKFLSGGEPYEKSDIIFLPRYYGVFNGSEIEGLEPLEKSVVKGKADMDSFVKDLSSGLGVPVLEDGGNEAYYDMTEDTVHVPPRKAFESTYSFNSTLLHELVHSTGSAGRLGRFGREDHSYAAEELTAELSSCFLGKELEEKALLENYKNHGAYLASWKEMIKDDSSLLIRAVSDASDAVSYVNDTVKSERQRNGRAVSDEEKVQIC